MEHVAKRSRLVGVALGVAMAATLSFGLARVALAASLNVNPGSGLAGSTVSVSGDGFPAAAPVSLYLSGIPIGTTTSDSSGGINTSFTVPEVPGATYIVYATDAVGGFLANATFSIPGPGFTLTPSRAVAGSSIALMTGGVKPGSVLHVDFSGIPEGTFQSDSAGIASGSFTVPVQPPPGDYVVEATTASGAFFGSAIFTILSPDTTPPTMTCTAAPSRIWPPDHRLVDVGVSVVVSDTGSGPAGFTLDSVTSSELDSGLGDGDQAGDINGFTIGTAGTSGQLRAERSGSGIGRTYTLTYTGRDVAGNTAQCVVTVVVPHDLG